MSNTPNDNMSELERYQKTKKVSDMPQAVVSMPTEAEINATAEVKMKKGRSFSVGTVISVANALKDNIFRIGKYRKFRQAHQGVVEIPQTWKTEDTFGLVTDGSSSAYQFIPADPRPVVTLGKNEDGKVLTTPGTFTASTINISKVKYLNPYTNVEEEIETEARTDIKYNDDASSSSSSGTGLVSPLSPAAASDQAQFKGRILDMPGKTDGEAMDPENYLSLPGRDIKTSETFIYQEEMKSSSSSS